MRMTLVPILAICLSMLAFATRATAHDGGIMKVSATFLPSGMCSVRVVIDEEHLPDNINPFTRSEATALDDFVRTFVAASAMTFDRASSPLRLEECDVLAAGSDRPRRIGLSLSTTVPVGAATAIWSHHLLKGEYFLQFQNEGDAEATGQWLDKGRSSEPYVLAGTAAPQSTGSVIATYLGLGFTHIIPYGVDHILFVLGLYLLGNSLKSLLTQVTAFTVAHSITLGLTVCDHLSVPRSIVEPAIAASIVFVAAENMFAQKAGWWRTAVVFAFGLLHGMGFAGVLQDLGLPRAHFLPALLSFNVGVELGQLAVILVATCLLGAMFGSKHYYRSRIVIPVSLVIGSVGVFWTVQRIAG